MTQATDTPPAEPRDLYWDPFDPTLRDDPYPLWKRLRDEAPAVPQRAVRLLGAEPLRRRRGRAPRPVTFSSAHGTTLEMMGADPSHAA